ncbi:MAG: response regulator [Deltaproteobacteria bacterium]|jgi:CheY-like chemotaxis protein
MNTESPLKGKTILAVDDEPDVLDTLEELLDMCRVVKKSNYEDAVAYLNNESPDLAILDIMGVNGFDLLERCVAKKIDAVMLTANAFSLESLKKSLDLGARAYLPKEKMADIVSFLEDVVTMEHGENWQRLFNRLGGLLNATFGADWNKDLIEIGPFIVPE